MHEWMHNGGVGGWRDGFGLLKDNVSTSLEPSNIWYAAKYCLMLNTLRSIPTAIWNLGISYNLRK
jgi:hypothetical protein